MFKNKVLIFALLFSIFLHFLLLGGWRYFYKIVPKKIDYIEFLLMQYKKAPAFDSLKGVFDKVKVKIPSTRITPFVPEQISLPMSGPLRDIAHVKPKPKIEITPVKDVSEKAANQEKDTSPEWEEVSESELGTANVVISYRKLLQQLIIQYLEYPKEERKMGITGEVVVSFVVARDGKLREVSVLSQYRSPVEAFNEASIEAVKKASPMFPPFPLTCKEPEIRFVVKIHFE